MQSNCQHSTELLWSRNNTTVSSSSMLMVYLCHRHICIYFMHCTVLSLYSPIASKIRLSDTEMMLCLFLTPHFNYSVTSISIPPLGNSKNTTTSLFFSLSSFFFIINSINEAGEVLWYPTSVCLSVYRISQKVINRFNTTLNIPHCIPLSAPKWTTHSWYPASAISNHTDSIQSTQPRILWTSTE